MANVVQSYKKKISKTEQRDFVMALFCHSTELCLDVLPDMESLTLDRTDPYVQILPYAIEHVRLHRTPIGTSILLTLLCPTDTYGNLIDPSKETENLKLVINSMHDRWITYTSEYNPLTQQYQPTGTVNLEYCRDTIRDYVDRNNAEFGADVYQKEIAAGTDPFEAYRRWLVPSLPQPREKRPLFYRGQDPTWNRKCIPAGTDEEIPRDEIYGTLADVLYDEHVWPGPGKFWLFASSSGLGKTQQAIHLAKELVRHRSNVIFITFENNEEEIMARLHQAMFALIDRRYAGTMVSPEVEIPIFLSVYKQSNEYKALSAQERSKYGHDPYSAAFLNLTEEAQRQLTRQDEQSTQRITITRELTWLQSAEADRRIAAFWDPTEYTLPGGKKWIYRAGGDIFLRQFDPISKTPQDLELFIEEVIREAKLIYREKERPTNWVETDSDGVRQIVKHDSGRSVVVQKRFAVIVDHMNDLAAGTKDDNRPRWAVKGDDVRQLRRIASKFKVPVYSATQMNLEGAVDESKQKKDATDILVKMYKTPVQREKGEAELEFDKGRGVKDGMRLLITQCTLAGQFCLDARIITGNQPAVVKQWQLDARRIVISEGKSLQEAAGQTGMKADTVTRYLKKYIADNLETAQPDLWEEIKQRTQ